jgi:tRNA dimethylallyltransferase
MEVGYRELLPVLTAEEGSDISALRKKAIEQMKTHTKAYARLQLTGIKNKLVPECQRLGPKLPIYILDATDPTTWVSKVVDPAISISKGTSPFTTF